MHTRACLDHGGLATRQVTDPNRPVGLGIGQTPRATLARHVTPSLEYQLPCDEPAPFPWKRLIHRPSRVSVGEELAEVLS